MLQANWVGLNGSDNSLSLCDCWWLSIESTHLGVWVKRALRVCGECLQAILIAIISGIEEQGYASLGPLPASDMGA